MQIEQDPISASITIICHSQVCKSGNRRTVGTSLVYFDFVKLDPARYEGSPVLVKKEMAGFS
jgi:hypothetical protein